MPPHKTAGQGRFLRRCGSQKGSGPTHRRRSPCRAVPAGQRAHTAAPPGKIAAPRIIRGEVSRPSACQAACPAVRQKRRPGKDGDRDGCRLLTVRHQAQLRAARPLAAAAGSLAIDRRAATAICPSPATKPGERRHRRWPFGRRQPGALRAADYLLSLRDRKWQWSARRISNLRASTGDHRGRASRPERRIFARVPPEG